MEALRCSVSSLFEAQFGCVSGATAVLCSGTDVLLSNGSKSVVVWNSAERKGVHQLPGAIRHVTSSPRKRGLYALCENGRIYYIDLAQHPRVSSSPASAPNSHVIEDPTACSFLVMDSILVTVGPADGTWRFQFYETPDAPGTRHRKLAERGVPVGPVDSAAAEANEVSEWPALCCVFAFSAASGLPEGEEHYFLESTLFGLLFGIDVSLVSTPVVVCGLPDGRLCCLPSLPQSANRDAKPGVKLLHSLEEPVVLAGTSSGGDALLAVSRFGKVLIVQVGDRAEGGKAPVFRECSVPGPVVCACIGSTHLYYSTLSDLLALPLVTGSSLDRTAEENLYADPPPSFPYPRSLNVSRLIALAKPTNTSTGGVLEFTGFNPHIFCRGRTPRGRDCPREAAGYNPAPGVRQRSCSEGLCHSVKYYIVLSVPHLSDENSFLGPGCRTDPSVKRAASLKSSIQMRNEALKKLNQVFNVCCLLLPMQKGSEVPPVSKPPISIHFETRWIRLLQQDSLTLQCTLENSSSYVLEQGWTLCIQVIPSYSALNPEGRVSTKTYTFPLKKLFPGKNTEMVLPLTSGNELPLPLKVTSSLVYSLQSILGAVEAGHLFTEGTPSSGLTSNTGYISLTLDTTTVDWLDCMLVTGPTDENSSSRPGSASSTNIVRTFLDARRGERQDQSSSDPGVGTVEGGPFVATIRVSSVLLRAVLKGTGSLCSSLLTWLLSGCPGNGVRRDPQCSVVCACCPRGNTLRLMAKEVLPDFCTVFVAQVSVEDLGEGRPIAAVELLLESSSVAALCGLHYSVLRRIQALLKEVAMETEGPAQLQGRGLCRALERVEVLFEEIQEACGSAALDVGTSSGITAKLLHVYQQLRTNPLLIL
ncbi:Fanconi anemia-associated protein of 100 kDa-like [Scleropages formosus]|uniref:Fanconi anemia-associated protein of 100 kDa-like n=1 Tax=Scleropages formosus TaxID=113540 RepID=A0A0N8K049_SCLFO|nr:Fanconi anemia-associated protein of 100 kDa-like [Scleropages formosus]